MKTEVIEKIEKGNFFKKKSFDNKTEEKKEFARVNKKKIIKIICLEIVIMFFIFVACGIRWSFNTFDNCSIEGIIFQLSEPLEGTSESVIKEGILNIFGYGAIVGIIFNVVYFFIIKILERILKEKKKVLNFIKIGLYLISLIIILTYTSKKSNLKGFIDTQLDTSTFFEENYVDPNNVSIAFPEEKRNLIYIILESMETSYADKENNGCMEKNLMPELTKLMEENINFSHNENSIGGAYSYTGTGWTVGALVSEMTGMPLKLSIGGNDYGKFANFLPGATALGDILEDNGYNQMFICGSPISFGGRDKFFSQHGNYEILDYDKAVETGRYTKERENWGYIDKYLYEYSKEEILRLSKENKPFNVTLLTADTHHPNGFLCEDCLNESDKKYANVISCASKQVVDFVEWIKTQDFYENTTIVIIGDHPTMSTAFTDIIPEDYKRTTINCFINSAVTTDKIQNRYPAPWDMFPTVLASLGVKIEGERLGIGTNLFSDKQTLQEEFEPDYVQHFLSKKSIYYDKYILKSK